MADDSNGKGQPPQGDEDRDSGRETADSGLGGVDAGSPGGMGGAGVSGATGTGRPPGGMSPLLGDPHNEATEDES